VEARATPESSYPPASTRTRHVRVLRWQFAGWCASLVATVAVGDAGFLRLNSSAAATMPVLLQDALQWTAFICFLPTVVLAVVIGRGAWIARGALSRWEQIAASVVILATAAFVVLLAVFVYLGVQDLGNSDIAP
jgi:hypothetical protein